jgi:hypothetical protein
MSQATNNSNVIPIETAIKIRKQPPPPNKIIQDEWVPWILARSAEDGVTLNMICQEIKNMHGVTVGRPQISRIISHAKQERSAQSQFVIRENIGTYILGDLEILKKMKAELLKEMARFKKDDRSKDYFAACDRIVTLSKMLFELSGAKEKQVDDDAEAAKAELIEKFKDLAPKRK